MAEPGDAVAFIGDAPFEVLKALLGRLSPKCILRMRSVCKAWRDKLCSRALLAPLHREEPPRPLLCFDSAACPDRYLRLRDYRVESLDLGSDKLRYVFRFPKREFYDFDDNDLWGRDAPHIEASRVDFEGMENDVDRFRQQLFVHGSLDGYLLVSFAFHSYVINPATRRWVWLPYLEDLGDLQVAGFYEHVPSGDYRVLCVTGRHIREEEPTCWYHVLHVSPVQLRYIGRPISPAAPEDQVLRSQLAYGVETPCISPPIQFKRNHHLHWPPQDIQQYHMLVFDTEKEEFSWKNPPPEIEEEIRLLEFPNGDLGLSLSRMNKPTLELWCLQDYQNDVWVPVYRIHLALQVQQMPRLLRPLDFFWVPAVVSPEGDMLI
ncbi:unnamed protein product [Miscanthus lutarioriparius]|uniref:F-box domain-containing protein n=1 Tax=Miscanthus lutarioriparius TaxID=422564 RepID=A0A811RH15_9POAL|nr:unnamed protein product [Miscanthus lutarioriparius]